MVVIELELQMVFWIFSIRQNIALVEAIGGQAKPDIGFVGLNDFQRFSKKGRGKIQIIIKYKAGFIFWGLPNKIFQIGTNGLDGQFLLLRQGSSENGNLGYGIIE